MSLFGSIPTRQLTRDSISKTQKPSQNPSGDKIKSHIIYSTVGTSTEPRLLQWRQRPNRETNLTKESKLQVLIASPIPHRRRSRNSFNPNPPILQTRAWQSPSNRSNNSVPSNHTPENSKMLERIMSQNPRENVGCMPRLIHYFVMIGCLCRTCYLSWNWKSSLYFGYNVEYGLEY